MSNEKKMENEFLAYVEGEEKNPYMEPGLRNPWKLDYVEGSEKDLWRAAVQQSGMEISYVPRPDEYQVLQDYFKECGLDSIQTLMLSERVFDSYVQGKEKDLPEQAIWDKVKADLTPLYSIVKLPDIQQLLSDIKQIWEHGRGWQLAEDQTPEHCLAVVSKDGLALPYVKEQTLEIAVAAAKQNPEAIQHVKPEFKDAVQKELDDMEKKPTLLERISQAKKMRQDKGDVVKSKQRDDEISMYSDM